jgi:Homeodomain-like domain-containing protein
LTRRQKTTNDLLQWRRAQTIKLLSQGLTIDEVANILQVSPKTVQRDHVFVRQSSKQILQNWFMDTLPNEVLKNVARLTAINDTAWSLARKAREDHNAKIEIEALRLAREVAKDITEIATNNKSLIDAAWDANSFEQHLNSMNKQMDSSDQHNEDDDDGSESNIIEYEEEEE